MIEWTSWHVGLDSEKIKHVILRVRVGLRSVRNKLIETSMSFPSVARNDTH